MTARDTEPAPPPPPAWSDPEELSQRLGAAIRQAMGGPVEELRPQVRITIGLVLVRVGLRMIEQTGLDRQTLMAQLWSMMLDYRCPCSICEARRVMAKCNTRGGSA